ncbi:MAG: hypothetical protein V7744_02220 [Pseudomonadales bacterium]
MKIPILLISSILFCSNGYAGSSNPTEPDDDKWRFTIAFPMLWAPEVNGRVRGGENIDFNIDFKDILENLDFGFMGEVYAHKGNFGFAYRLNYLKLKNETTSGDILKTTVGSDLILGINDFLGTFRVHEKVRLMAGIRNVYSDIFFNIRTDLNGENLIDKKIPVNDSDSYDLLFGLHFDHWFNDRWGLMLNADTAVAGDNDRDYSLELRALYRISKLNNIWIGYRYLNIGQDVSSENIDYQLDFTEKGPTLGWAFTF